MTLDDERVGNGQARMQFLDSVARVEHRPTDPVTYEMNGPFHHYILDYKIEKNISTADGSVKTHGDVAIPIQSPSRTEIGGYARTNSEIVPMMTHCHLQHGWIMTGRYDRRNDP